MPHTVGYKDLRWDRRANVYVQEPRVVAVEHITPLRPSAIPKMQGGDWWIVSTGSIPVWRITAPDVVLAREEAVRLALIAGYDCASLHVRREPVLDPIEPEPVMRVDPDHVRNVLEATGWRSRAGGEG